MYHSKDIREGNGNPLRYSCLENPRDRAARWAAGYRVAQSRARLKQCSSSKDMWLPWWLSGKESACQCRRCGFHLWVRKIPWRRNWQPMPVLLPRKSHRQRSLVGYSPWDREESDTTSPLNNDIIPVSSFCVHSKSNMSNLIIKNFN